MNLKKKLANLEEFASAGGGDKAIKRHVEKIKNCWFEREYVSY